MPKLGQMLPRLLVDRGIDVAFGIPGVHTVEMYRGLPGSGLRHVTPRHEQGAGFMADGYARATGKPAACFIITGPGMTNIATAMGQAYGDSIPMLVISSVNRREDLGRGTGQLHELQDQQALAEGVAAWSRTVLTGPDLVDALDEAMALFATERPRPVHIQIPIDVLSEPCDDIGDKPLAFAPAEPDHAAVRDAASALNDAGSRVLILGGGAVGLGRDRATALAERLGALTLLTSNARGLLAPDHPMLSGCLAAPKIRDRIAEAAAVLVIGSELGPTDFDYYESEPVLVDGTLIRVDVDGAALTRNAAPDLAIKSDAATFTDALLPFLDQGEPTPPAPRDAAQFLEARLSRHLPLLQAIWGALPEAILIGDSTEPAYAGLVDARPPAPRRWWTTATGFGTLGYALPAAIGAKIAEPGRPVVAIAGDGGVLFSLPELASAAEAGAPVILIVWNNSGYGEIRDYMVSAQIEPAGVDLCPVDFAALATGFGAAYQRATTLDQMREALATASKHTASTLIEIREDEWTL